MVVIRLRPSIDRKLISRSRTMYLLSRREIFAAFSIIYPVWHLVLSCYYLKHVIVRRNLRELTRKVYIKRTDNSLAECI